MQKTFKRMLSVLCAVILLCTMCPFGTWMVSAVTAGDYTYKLNADNVSVTITGYSGSATELVVPDTIDGYSVTSIGGYAFYQCAALESITLPDSISSIGEWAFRDCTSLKNIMLPDGLTDIGDVAFYNCRSLKHITIPDSVIRIGEYAFYYCVSLKTVYYGGTEAQKDKISIGAENNIFMYAIWYYSVVTEYQQDNFTYVICRDNTATVVKYTGSAVESVIPAIVNGCPVVSVGKKAFSESATLKKVVFPDSVTSIGDYAFCDCKVLESITLPDSVTSIGDFAFYDCKMLESITLPDSLIHMGEGAFDSCAKLKTVNIPNGLTSLESFAFYGCSSLESVRIPDGLTNIAQNVFRGCTALKTIVLPDSVTSIDRNAFYYCPSLEVVYYGGTKQQWNAIAIKDDNSELTTARIHYGTTTDHWQVDTILTPNGCDKDGTATYICVCGYTDDRPLPAHGHTFKNNVCVECGAAVADCVASAHKYPLDYDNTWIIHQGKAVCVSLTFSMETYVDDGYDFIYIYDGDNCLVGTYTGAQLADQTVTVQGDTVKIRLVSDESMTYYGFSVTDVTYELCDDCLIGDLNGDGDVNIADATMAFRAVNGRVTLTAEEEAVANVNNDSEINIADATMLFRFVNGRISTLEF